MKISFALFAAVTASSFCFADAVKEEKNPLVRVDAKGKAGAAIKKDLKTDFNKLSEEERKNVEKRWAEMRGARQAKFAADRKAREEAAAKKLGITVEELRLRREKRVAEQAGVSFEEWEKLDKKARREKLVAQIRKNIAERDEALAKKEGVSVDVIRARRQERMKKRPAGKRSSAKPRPGAVKVVPPGEKSSGK